jgi:hypothetical protein
MSSLNRADSLATIALLLLGCQKTRSSRDAESRAVARTKALLAQHKDVNDFGPMGFTALLAAATEGLAELAAVLLAHADINPNLGCKETGNTPLIAASEDGHLAVVTLLLRHGDIAVNQANKAGQTPLLVACQHGRYAVVKLLLSRDEIAINTCVDGVGSTPLNGAASCGHAEVVRLLLSREDLVLDEEELANAIGASSERGHTRVVRLLVAYAARAEMRRVARGAAESLSAELLLDAPEAAAEAATLCLPLFAAAALGETEEERAAADVLAFESDKHRRTMARRDERAAQTPGLAEQARKALARSPPPAADAKLAAELDAVRVAATSVAQYRAAQRRQTPVNDALGMFELKVLAPLGFDYAVFHMETRASALRVTQAEGLARLVLMLNRHSRTGLIQALAAEIKVHVDARVERDKLERAVSELVGEVSATSISPVAPQPVALSAAESGTATGAACSGSSAGARGAGEGRRCARPGCPDSATSTCSACTSVEYCSRACQKSHWPAHKTECKAKSGRHAA